MDQSFWAGVASVETASQLAFGGVLLGSYFRFAGATTRGRNWPGYAVACLASATLSASTLGLLLVGGDASRWFSALFAVSVSALVLSMILAQTVVVSRLSSVRITLFSVALALATGVVFWRVPPLRLVPQAGPAQLLRFEYTAAGRALLAVLCTGLISSIVFLRRVPNLERVVRRGYSIGFSLVVVTILLDCLGLSAFVSPVPLVTHAGVLGCLILWAFSLMWGHRLSQHGEVVMAELTASKQALSESRAQIEQMRRELGTKKQLAAVGELAAAIAHEVRNPLAIIVNAVAGLRRPTIQVQDRNTLLGILDEETARLNRLVTDLLRFARPVIIKRASVSIPELAKRVEGRLEDNQVLALEIPDDPTLRVVQADANLLRLVFDNLVANAFQAMPDGGTVQIVVSSEGAKEAPFVRIDIVDHGQGMEEQVRVRAIDPFYTTRPSGTGLGLPIVQRIVEAHGGRINIDSAPGQGTTVSLFLPVLTADGNEAPREGIW